MPYIKSTLACLSVSCIFLLSCWSNNQLVEKYEQKLKLYLQKDSAVGNFIRIHTQGIDMYASAQDKQQNKPEFSITWDNIALLQALIKANPSKAWQLYQQKNINNILLPNDTLSAATTTIAPNNASPLQGLRIALDAGHFGGSLQEAKAEQRFIEMTIAHPTNNNKDSLKIAFFEAELAWFTTQILKQKLEKAGATVFLTRPDRKKGAKAENFLILWKQLWQTKSKKNKPKQPQDSLQAFNQFLVQYKKDDFALRYQKINEFKPNITLIVHYNVDAENDAWNKPTPKNYNMAFVAGSFTNKELTNPSDRFQLLRLLISEDIEQSIQLSNQVLLAFERVLKVPTIPVEEGLGYLKDYCLLTERQGVYARNLTLCREIFGTLCYGESLYQDNKQEVLNLSQKDFAFENQRTAQRVAQVAEAYYQAILQYSQAKK